MLMKSLLALALVVGFFLGCASPPGTSPADASLKAAFDGCTAASAGVKAADAALVSGQLSKANAQKAYTGFAAMQAGCNAAVAALAPPTPASAASGVTP